MQQDIVKDINYYATSVVGILTLYTSWRAARYSYHIIQTKRTIRQLEKTEIVAPEEIKGRGEKVNELVILRVSLRL